MGRVAQLIHVTIYGPVKDASPRDGGLRIFIQNDSRFAKVPAGENHYDKAPITIVLLDTMMIPFAGQRSRWSKRRQLVLCPSIKVSG